LAKPTYFLPTQQGLAATPMAFLAVFFFCAAYFCLGGVLDLAAAALAAFEAVAALVGESKTSAVGLVMAGITV